MSNVEIFVYGTLRAEYSSAHDRDVCPIVQALAPDHRLVGDPGLWRLSDFALMCKRPDGSIGIPAITPWVDSQVLGDVISVNADDFTSLARYEGFPDLYQIINVTVRSGIAHRDVWAFMPPPVADTANPWAYKSAMSFGSRVWHGDYLRAIDERRAEIEEGSHATV